MKILFLAKCLNASGVTTHMVTLGEELEEMGHKVAILSGGIPKGNESHVERIVRESSLEFIYNNFPTSRKNIFLELAMYMVSIPKTLFLIRKFKPDMIHVHWPVTGYIAKLHKILFKTPIVQTFHIGNTPKTILHSKGDAIIAISSELENEILSKHEFESNQVHKVFNGVKRELFRKNEKEADEFKEKLKLNLKDIIITCVGSFEHRKGLDILLKACSLLEDDIRFKLLLVGDGDLIWINELISKYELSTKVETFDFQNPYDFYNITDIFVLPSRREGFPLVAVEAMLMECALIRSNVEGAYDQILDKETGLIFESENVQQLKKQLMYLIKNNDERKAMSIKGMQRAEKYFTAKEMAKKTNEVYKKARKFKE